MFESLRITGNNLVYMDDKVLKSLNKLLTNEVYFTVLNDNIYLASTLKKLVELRKKENKSVSFCSDLESCYLDSGLIIPPFTIFKHIYKMPVFSKFHKHEDTYILSVDSEFLNINPFLCESDIFEHLTEILVSEIDEEKAERILCTLSGGVDSAVLLSLLFSIKMKKNIDSLCCEMPNLQNESEKAKRVASFFDSNFIIYEPGAIDPEVIINNYLENYGNLVFDPVVPVISKMLYEYKESFLSKSNQKILLVEGQGADTVMFGLPHAFTLAIYQFKLSYLFKALSVILPSPNESIRRRSRFLYRIVKSIHLLSEKTWQESVFRSLSIHNLRGTDYYLCYMEMIDSYFSITKDRQKALVLFFLQIISTRELQKYQLLGKQVKPILPFMNQEFVSRCLVTRTSMFFRFPYRKIPLFTRAKEVYGNLFKSKKTFPFVVDYGNTNKATSNADRVIKDDYSFRKYCLDMLIEQNVIRK